MSTARECEWLHTTLKDQPQIHFPFDLEGLPRNGIYFFYEDGETWGHGGELPRIVRVGTHRQGNFRSRIADHFLIGRKIELSRMRPAPKDRSIFRKNLGRAILNQSRSKYVKTWEVDFTTRTNREHKGALRNLELEAKVEAEITEVLRTRFSFRFVEVREEDARLGSKGLEAKLIGTLSRCGTCTSSENWLGRHSPVRKIRESGLWQVQHLGGPGLDQEDRISVEAGLRSA